MIYGIIDFSLSVKNMIVLMNKIFIGSQVKGKKKAEIFKNEAEKQQKRMEQFEMEDYEKNTFK